MKQFLFSIALLGSITLYAQPANDDKVNATLLTNLNDWASADAAYSNATASSDESYTGCSGNAPRQNVWFKFVATTSEVEIKATTGGTKGDMGYPHIVLVDQNGVQVDCDYHSTSGNGVAYIQNTSINPSETYYFSVENGNGASGTFTLEITDNISYDLKEKAELLTDLNDWSSADAGYSNATATSDESYTGCTGNAPRQNVWFKFVATTSEIEIKATTGGTKGNMGYPHIVLVDQNGVQVDCDYHSTSGNGVAYIQNTSINPSETYYFSVENGNGFVGTFTLEITDNISYDLKEKAELLTDLNDWSSADAAYSNATATSDESYTGCTGNAPRQNVWFKFVATTSEVEIKATTGGTKGDMGYPHIVLVDQNGVQVDCDYHSTSGNGVAYVQNTSINPTETYYFSVENGVGSIGTFTIEITDDISYDLKEKAELLTDLNDWSSADAAYSNATATSDESYTGCTGNAPRQNVWFKFVATTSEIEIKATTGGTKGDMGYPHIVLVDQNGVQVDCDYHSTSGNGVAYVQNTSINPSETYYFSVENGNGFVGTFTLEVSDSISFDLKEKAVIIPHAPTWCKQNFYSNAGATPDGNISGACGNSTGNVWFSFVASSEIVSINLQTGNEFGTISYPRLYLVDDAGNVVDCNNSAGYQSVLVQDSSLVVGDTYYISVDNTVGDAGTFSICVLGGVEASQLCSNIYCDTLGGVGIGTTDVPENYLLAVAGKGIFEEVQVALKDYWPDYVFEEGYVLKSISELSDFIKVHKHLPGIPSAEDVERDGIEIGEISTMLLKKIEEMTLYQIQLHQLLNEEMEKLKLLQQRANALAE